MHIGYGVAVIEVFYQVLLCGILLIVFVVVDQILLCSILLLLSGVNQIFLRSI